MENSQQKIKKELTREGTGGTFFTHLTTMVVVAMVVTVLAAFGIITFFTVPGVSVFYIAIGFYVPFAMWFGMWGILGNSLGCTLGAIIAGVPIPLTIVANTIPHIFQSGLPAWAVKGLGMNPALKDGRDWKIYLLVCVIATVVIPGIIFMAIMAAFGIMEWSAAFSTGILSYVIGDIIVILLISTLLLKGLSPLVKESRFYIQGWWN